MHNVFLGKHDFFSPLFYYIRHRYVTTLKYGISFSHVREYTIFLDVLDIPPPRLFCHLQRVIFTPDFRSVVSHAMLHSYWLYSRFILPAKKFLQT